MLIKENIATLDLTLDALAGDHPATSGDPELIFNLKGTHGAADRTRTGDILLGKETFYQLNYCCENREEATGSCQHTIRASARYFPNRRPLLSAPQEGFEPSTQGSRGPCVTNYTTGERFHSTLPYSPLFSAADWALLRIALKESLAKR